LPGFATGIFRILNRLRFGDFPVNGDREAVSQTGRLSTVQGRSSSPDPLGLAAMDLTNPQTFNLYFYVGNNPLSKVDPLGLDDCSPDEPDCRDPCHWDPLLCDPSCDLPEGEAPIRRVRPIAVAVVSQHRSTGRGPAMRPRGSGNCPPGLSAWAICSASLPAVTLAFVIR
jgi:hypothetical protein